MKYLNNPYCIKRSYRRWYGSCARSRDTYERFERLEYGVRAFLILLLEFCFANSDCTVHSLVNYFSPTHAHDFLYQFEGYVNIRLSEELVDFAYEVGFLPTTKTHFLTIAKVFAVFLGQVTLEDELLERCWNYYIENSKFPFFKDVL